MQFRQKIERPLRSVVGSKLIALFRPRARIGWSAVRFGGSTASRVFPSLG
jgi:hypothetical protein